VSLTDTPSARARVPTAGAWLGVGIAARGALGAIAHFVPLLLVAGIPLLVDLLDRQARAQEAPPEWARVTDLWLDLAQVLGPFARIAGGSGAMLGVVLFVAAVFLVRGSDVARRACRVLLVMHAAHSIAAAVWFASVATGPLAEWEERYAKAITDLQDVAPGIQENVFAAFRALQSMNAVGQVACAVSLAFDALLFWLAGRASARAWCDARKTRDAPAASAAKR
jgi:hypothetical protein